MSLVDKATRLTSLMWLLVACVLVSISAVCDTGASTETGSCVSSSKGVIEEETAFVQIASEVHASAQRNGRIEAGLHEDERQLARPEPTLPPVMPLLKGMLSDMVQNVSMQVAEQKDALCGIIRGEVTDPLTMWLRGLMKSCTDATASMVMGANLAGQIAVNAVNESTGAGDLDYVLKALDSLLGETIQNVTKRMTSFANQVERVRTNFTPILDSVGLHGLAEVVSDVRLNQTVDLLLNTLKTLEEASVGLGNESVPAAQKIVKVCRENIGKWVKGVDTMTLVAEAGLQTVVAMMQSRLHPILMRTPFECNGELPVAIEEAGATVRTATDNLRKANLQFNIQMKKVLVILTEALEKTATSVAEGDHMKRSKDGARSNSSGSSSNSSNKPAR